MLLNDKEFDILPEHVADFFTVMDSFEKIILSKDLAVELISDSQKEEFCVYIVSDHAIGLPKNAEKLLKPYMTLVQDKRKR